MCSSLLGLGGTYVQQCFMCFFPQYLCAAFSCIFKSNAICLLSTRSSSRRSELLSRFFLFFVKSTSCCSVSVTSSLGSCSRRWTFSSRTRIFRVFRHFWPAGLEGVDGRPFFFSSVVKIFRVFRHFWPGKTRWGRSWLDVLFVFFSHPFFVSSRLFST